MPKFVAFFVFDGTEIFKSLSISSLENLENLLCNAIFSKNFSDTYAYYIWRLW